MKVFLDANILVTVLNKEYPLFPYAAKVLSLADNPNFGVYTSPICLAIAFYFAEKKSGSDMARKKISLLASKIKITTTDQTLVEKTIANKSIKDFEDGLEYYSAMLAQCKCIVTEDADDFFFSAIEVVSTQTFLKKYV